MNYAKSFNAMIYLTNIKEWLTAHFKIVYGKYPDNLIPLDSKIHGEPYDLRFIKLYADKKGYLYVLFTGGAYKNDKDKVYYISDKPHPEIKLKENPYEEKENELKKKVIPSTSTDNKIIKPAPLNKNFYYIIIGLGLMVVIIWLLLESK